MVLLTYVNGCSVNGSQERKYAIANPAGCMTKEEGTNESITDREKQGARP